MRLANKVIIITGASKGLGVSMSETCAREGAKVVLAARSKPELETVAKRIRAAGGAVEVVPTDMSKPDQLESLVSHAVKCFGRIDGLINNAGVNYVKPFLEIDPIEWQHVLTVDLTGSFLLTQFCARHMARQGGGGSIVQIASVHTHAAVAGAAPYDAAKHGMVGFSKAAAVELAPLGIRVNILSPGLCETEIWKDLVAAAPSETAEELCRGGRAGGGAAPAGDQVVVLGALCLGVTPLTWAVGRVDQANGPDSQAFVALMSRMGLLLMPNDNPWNGGGGGNSGISRIGI
jgi:NAD(P)-dependent dehydrogenase (short-subunit alcohol dehydrogenase family)